MRIVETTLPGAVVLEPEKQRDERGFFARVWCARELEDRGLCAHWVQSSISFNDRAGTLRGLHFQTAPHAEVRMVTCTAGAVFDVMVDLRPGFPSFGKWFSIELTADNNKTLYVPEGFAHGFLTLEHRSVVQYHMSEYYHPEAAAGVRWDDPSFGINWPIVPSVISSRDLAYPDFRPPA
jgi:dTDP-4-dehydrorhamnose 3,5-epimerase